MERKKFLSAGLLGFSILNLPTFSFGQNNGNEAALNPFYIPPSQALSPGPGNINIRTIIHAKQTGKQISNVERQQHPRAAACEGSHYNVLIAWQAISSLAKISEEFTVL